MKEIYSIKLTTSDKPIVLTYVRGFRPEVDKFIELVYGGISDKIAVFPLTSEGKFKFPWGFSKKVIELDKFFKSQEVNKTEYLIRIQNDFFRGTLDQMEKYLDLLQSQMIRLDIGDQVFLDKKIKFESIAENWAKALPNQRKLKKFWNRRVKI